MSTSVSPSGMVLLSLVAFIAASVWLGTKAHQVVEKGKFLEGFFLGNRGLGAWALALTATVQSGGTFMGFPSLVYSHGWIVAMWIGSYMVVPLTGFAIVGKRLSQLSRRTQALTVPDLFRERFQSPAIGLIASLIVMLLMMLTMIAQFKAGAIVMKLAWPGTGFLSFSEDLNPNLDLPFYVGLAIFSTTVIGYTLIGGFLASVWTDLFQSVMMLFGVMLLLCLALPAAGGLEAASRQAVLNTSDAFAFGPGHYPSNDPSKVARAFLTPGLAFSMFFTWIWAGFSSPASMIRVMAAQNSEVIRKSIVLLSVYNCMIYLPLIMICVAARAIMPDLAKPDETIPRMALLLTKDIPGGSLLAGIILAAPFGAIMASVSCFLLVIASGVVRDIYLRFLRPGASVQEVKRMTTLAMLVVGAIAIGFNIRPAQYLQALIVMSSTCGGAAFAVPAIMACYWKRATAAGALSAMLGGFLTIVVLYGLGWLHTWSNWKVSTLGTTAPALANWVTGWLGPDQGIGVDVSFRPYFLWGLDPLVWGLLASAILGITISRWTRPPNEHHIARMFGESST